MKIFKLLSIIFFINSIVAYSTTIETLEQFNKIKSKMVGFQIVEFYKPLCIDCKNLEKSWNALAYKYNDTFNFYKVNMSLDGFESLKNSENIEHYPMIIIYKKGKAIDQLVEPNPNELENLLYKTCQK